jgi:hypothetical protein
MSGDDLLSEWRASGGHCAAHLDGFDDLAMLLSSEGGRLAAIDFSLCCFRNAIHSLEMKQAKRSAKCAASGFAAIGLLLDGSPTNPALWQIWFAWSVMLRPPSSTVTRAPSPPEFRAMLAWLQRGNLHEDAARLALQFAAYQVVSKRGQPSLRPFVGDEATLGAPSDCSLLGWLDDREREECEQLLAEVGMA